MRRSRPYRVDVKGQRARRFRDLGAATKYARQAALEHGEARITFVGGYRSGSTVYRLRRSPDGTVRLVTGGLA